MEPHAFPPLRDQSLSDLVNEANILEPGDELTEVLKHGLDVVNARRKPGEALIDPTRPIVVALYPFRAELAKKGAPSDTYDADPKKRTSRQPFVDLQTPDTKLRQRLHVVLADSPRRPFNGNSQALNAPRAFLKLAAQTAAANLMTSQACDVLRELSGAQTDLCRHRLVPLGIFNPQDTYWDLGRLHPEAGVKLMGFRFKPNEVELDKETGLYKLREEVITSVDEDVDKGAWATWRFHPYPEAIKSRSGMTIAPAARLFDALDEME